MLFSGMRNTKRRIYIIGVKQKFCFRYLILRYLLNQLVMCDWKPRVRSIMEL